MSSVLLTRPAAYLPVAGVRVAYRRLGSGSPLVLVHGGAAHSGWWADVAPRLADRFEVVALDLTGHGDSDRRPQYEPATWAAEISAVIEQLDIRPATVVGHSMGGLAATYAAAERPELVGALICIDTPFRAARRASEFRQQRIYGSREEALSRFRLRPPDSHAAPELLAEVIPHGLARVEGGWMWKFDPSAKQRFAADEVVQRLVQVRCPVGFIGGDESPYAAGDAVEWLAAQLGRPVPMRTVRRAFHHVPLDNPAGCAAAIAELSAALDGDRVR